MIPVVTLVDGFIRLRIYEGERLKVSVPLSWPRAMLLANDLLGWAVYEQQREARDRDLLPRDSADERGVTEGSKDLVHGD
jgi:hypothetical protein